MSDLSTKDIKCSIFSLFLTGEQANAAGCYPAIATGGTWVRSQFNGSLTEAALSPVLKTGGALTGMEIDTARLPPTLYGAIY